MLFESTLKPIDKQYREKLNKIKAERNTCNLHRHTANADVNTEANCKIASLRQQSFAKVKNQLYLF